MLSEKESSNLNAISIFTGGGGFDIGLERAGIKVRLALESDKDCCATIRANRPDLPLVESDIRDVTADEILKAAGLPAGGVDVVFAGPPCQPFSTSGNRRAFDDERGDAFISFLDLSLNIRPVYILIENVRGLQSAKGPRGGRGGALRYVRRRLTKAGYKVTVQLYDSADYGVPQKRERLIIVASLRGAVAPAQPNGSRRTLRDAIADIATHDHAEFPDRLLRFLRLLGPGQDWRNLPVELQQDALGGAYRSSGGRTGYYRRLDWDRPSPTLVTSPTQKATLLCHPDQDRPLSLQEYAAIQQFPEDWVFCGGITARYRQIGNTVPTGLAEAVGRTLVEHDRGHARRNGRGPTPAEPSMFHLRAEPVFDFIDLYSGVGGATLALGGLGGRCVFAAEWDRFARETYRAWHGRGHPLRPGDIRELDPASLPPARIVSAGFPCQPHSKAGLCRGFRDERADNFFYLMRVVATGRHDAFVFENVKGILTERTWRLITGELDAAGYWWDHKVVNASHWVPQNRERVFVVLLRDGRQGFGWPEPPECGLRLRDILEPDPDPKHTLSDRGWAGAQRHLSRQKAKGSNFGYRMLDPDGLAPTLTTKTHDHAAGLFLPTDGNPRVLTPVECRRLMGFPDGLPVVVSDTQFYKQMGNSVVPAAVGSVGGAVLAALEGGAS